MSEVLRYKLACKLGFAHKLRDGDWGAITAREAGLLVRAACVRAEERLLRRQGGRSSESLLGG